MFSDGWCHYTISYKHTLNEKMGNISKCHGLSQVWTQVRREGEGAHDFKEKGRPLLGRTVRISYKACKHLGIRSW